MIDIVVVVLPLMLSPGPANLVSLVLGARHGVIQLLPFQLGILVVYGVVAIGVGTLANRIYVFAPAAVRVLQVIGGLFIVYLGIRLARRTQRDTADLAPTFFNGMSLQCLNPKFPGVVLTVFANRHSQSIWMVAATICIAGAIGLAAYSTAGSLLRPRDTSGNSFRAFDMAASGLLCAVGVWFILQPLLTACVDA